MFSKKSVSLTLNTIVIAAIVLIVLVVIVLIFTGKIGTFVGGTKDCYTLGGDCYPGSDQGGCKTAVTEAEPDDIVVPIYGAECEQEGQICCKIISPSK